MNPASTVSSRLLARWRAFADGIERDLDLVGTEDAVAALIDRSLLQDELDHGAELSEDDLLELGQADQAFSAAAHGLLELTDIALFEDDEPATHWWWHIEKLVVSQAPNAHPRRP
jgi:hypothetical protein